MKLFAIAATATVVLASAASAMTASQGELRAQNALDKYGFEVDAGTLSPTQWVGISAATSDNDQSDVQIKSRIAAVVGN